MVSLHDMLAATVDAPAATPVAYRAILHVPLDQQSLQSRDCAPVGAGASGTERCCCVASTWPRTCGQKIRCATWIASLPDMRIMSTAPERLPPEVTDKQQHRIPGCVTHGCC